MQFNHQNIQSDNNSQTLSAQARLLMSVRRQRIQHRSQSMLQRVVTEVGADA